MKVRLRDCGGFSFVAVLAALLIAAVLYFGYFRMQSVTGERAVGIKSIEVSKGIACRTQRQELERDVQMYAASHGNAPHSLDDLQRDGIRLPSCPESGRYALKGTRVTCTVHP